MNNLLKSAIRNLINKLFLSFAKKFVSKTSYLFIGSFYAIINLLAFINFIKTNSLIYKKNFQIESLFCN